jgi:hypothetical protein
MRTKEAWDRENNDKVSAIIKELARRSASLGLLAQKERAIKIQMQQLPPVGPKRVETLLALRESLNDPELIIRPELALEVATQVLADLKKKSNEWRETAHLCEIGGLTRRRELIDPIRDIYARATGLGLKSAARTALLQLGLTEDDLSRRAPIHTILVLEPNGFFRKRLMAALTAAVSWELREAAGRSEAEQLLAKEPADLILTESQDSDGDLASWFEQQWNANRFRYALISTANRDLGTLTDSPWCIGALFKPYPTEQLIRTLES